MRSLVCLRDGVYEDYNELRVYIVPASRLRTRQPLSDRNEVLGCLVVVGMMF